MNLIFSCFIIYDKKMNFPASDYLFKVKNRNTRKKCEICS